MRVVRPALVSSLLLLLTAAAQPLSAGNITHYWSKRFGDVETQAGYGAAADSLGSVFLTGLLRGTAGFGGPILASQGSDVFLAKFDAYGNHVWSRCFGDSSCQYGLGVAIDGSGSVVVWGGLDGRMDFGGSLLVNNGEIDVFIAKFDGNGNHLWSESFGDTTYLDIRGLVIDPSGNLTITGSFCGTVDFGGGMMQSAGESDAYVAKLSPQGAHLWSKSFGDAGYQCARSLALDPSGNAIVTGEFTGGVDFGGGKLTSAGGRDVFLLELDPSGAHIWSRQYGNEEWQSAQCAVADKSGNVIVMGFFEGTVDFGGGALACRKFYDIFLAKFNAAGDHLWSKRFGDMDFQYGWGIITDGTGNILATGGFRGTVDFGDGPLTSVNGSTDIFLANFDPNGNCLFSQRVGDDGEDFGLSIIKTASGFLLTGYFGSVVDFGGGPLLCAGESDVFLAKFKQSALNPPSGFAGTPLYLNNELMALTLAWNRIRDARIAHYNVYRDRSAHFIPGRGNLLASSADTFTVDPQWRWMPYYYYKVTAVDYAGNESAYASLGYDDIYTDAHAPGAPSLVSLQQNFPNPFNPSTSIHYYLPRECPVTLEIFDSAGRLVAKLLDHARQPEGRHSIVWGGKDERGRMVGSGVYFYRLRAGDATISKKMVLLK